MLVPLLICSTALSAVALSVKEAWNAVCKRQKQSVSHRDAGLIDRAD